MRTESVEGFVLHARDYRDTSQLVDIFCEDFGRVRLVAKGSRAQKKSSVRLSPFCSGVFSWVGRGELKTLTNCDSSAPLSLQGDNLICGFYINELLWHLLLPEDSHPQLYRIYRQTLAQLASVEDVEPILRVFELSLLDEVGYGINFEQDAVGDSILPHQVYKLNKEEGWLPVADASPASYLGSHIQAIAHRDFSEAGPRRTCKTLTRAAIDELLEGRSLNSRELIIQSRV